MARTVRRRAARPDPSGSFGGASRSALRQLRDAGMDIPDRPSGDRPPRLPRDVTDLNDSELMELFGALTQWEEYLAVQLAAAEIDEKDAAEKLKAAEAAGAIRFSGEKTVAAVKALVAELPEVQAAAETHSNAYAYRKLLAPLTEGVGRRAAYTSRELTRRVGREPRENRNGRWNP